MVTVRCAITLVALLSAATPASAEDRVAVRLMIDALMAEAPLPVRFPRFPDGNTEQGSLRPALERGTKERGGEKRVEAESLGRAVMKFRKEEQRAFEQREQREGDDAAMRVMLAAGSSLK